MCIVYMFYDAPYVIFPLTVSHEKENVKVPGALLLEVRLSLPLPSYTILPLRSGTSRVSGLTPL